MSKFTKGEWSASGSGTVLAVDDKNNSFDLVCDCGFGEVTVERLNTIQANARLIAAAPKMYNLLQRLIHVHGNNSFRFLKRLSGLLLEAKYLIKSIDTTETEV